MSARDPLDVAVAAARRHLAAIPERPVRPDLTGPEVGARLPPALAEGGGEPADTIAELEALVEPGLLGTGSPRFFGWVVGGTLPVALAADWRDSVSGVATSGPALARIEEQAGAWLVDLLGLPAGASFGFLASAPRSSFCLAGHPRARAPAFG